MRFYLLLFPILILAVFWSSCRKDFEYSISTGKLEFSKDTVYLDTIFTNIGSSTYTLKVYNRSEEDIEIPSIALGEGQNSSYRLNVDGVAGKEFRNIPVLGRDSIFIFIETTYDIAPVNRDAFLYTDVILFDSGANRQEVHLVTLVRDAIFLYPGRLADGSPETLVLGIDEEGNEIRTEGFVLSDDQLRFTNEKPYLIYGYAAVVENKELTMEGGTRVHFHRNSGILVGKGGTLNISGSLSIDPQTLEKEVIFEGDRLEPEFGDVSGQWGTIWLSQGSHNNVIEHLTIKNATVGLLVDGVSETGPPTLSIRNSQIYNSGTVNLWARHSQIEGENLVLGSAGNSSLNCSAGGNYSFVHSTISNYWSDGFRSGAALTLSNFSNEVGRGSQANDLTKANFTNCIIDGNTALELSLNSNNANVFNFSFTNCMLKFRAANGQLGEDPLYDFENQELYSEVILNGETDFINVSKDAFGIGSASGAIGGANLDAALLVPLDISGMDRTTKPDIGAYQHIPEE
jgi:hypothetical protein